MTRRSCGECVRGDPEQIHDAAPKEQTHQSPAATQTKTAVPETHSKRAAHSRLPVFRDERGGRAAMLEAGILEGAELVDAGCDQDSCTEGRARAHHISPMSAAIIAR